MNLHHTALRVWQPRGSEHHEVHIVVYYHIAASGWITSHTRWAKKVSPLLTYQWIASYVRKTLLFCMCTNSGMTASYIKYIVCAVSSSPNENPRCCRCLLCHCTAGIYHVGSVCLITIQCDESMKHWSVVGVPIKHDPSGGWLAATSIGLYAEHYCIAYLHGEYTLCNRRCNRLLQPKSSNLQPETKSAKFRVEGFGDRVWGEEVGC